MELTRAANALKGTVNTVKADVAEILASGNYYCTEEIARELSAINNGLEHLKFDNTLLTSKEWQTSFDPQGTATALAGAANVLDTAAARMFDFKSQMGAVSIGQKQENEVRELHQWAVTNLQEIQKDLEPYTYTATDRIKQFGDHIGVTDRYTGYRHNLTRGSRDPFKMETNWMDKGKLTGYMNPAERSKTSMGFPTREGLPPRPTLEQSRWGPVQPDNYGSLVKEVRFSSDRAPQLATRGYRTIDSLYPRSTTFLEPGTRPGGAPNTSSNVNNLRHLNAMNATLASRPVEKSQDTMSPMAQGLRSMSVQEQAGINITFPGRTEYMIRYNNPVESQKTSDFIINPTPNLHIFGRPLGKARYEHGYTEYQTRYEWPDGEKICKLPWLRK